MRRVLDSAWFLPSIGLVIGGLVVAGLVGPVPPWVRWICLVVAAVASIAPFLPILALLPWYFVAVRRGLVPSKRGPASVSVAQGALVVDHGAKHTRCDLKQVSSARRACNDNWTESKILEDAIGLFSAEGREIVRVPLSATGIDELVRALHKQGVPIVDVAVSAPVFLD